MYVFSYAFYDCAKKQLTFFGKIGVEIWYKFTKPNRRFDVRIIVNDIGGMFFSLYAKRKAP
jgi:hypothetical protein